LKPVGFKILWVNCTQLVQPHLGLFRRRRPNLSPGVAVQVAFERRILKPGFHLIGARVETRRLSAASIYGSGEVNVHRPPHHGENRGDSQVVVNRPQPLHQPDELSGVVWARRVVAVHVENLKKLRL
jgi:hypothetical protein